MIDLCLRLTVHFALLHCLLNVLYQDRLIIHIVEPVSDLMLIDLLWNKCRTECI